MTTEGAGFPEGSVTIFRNYITHDDDEGPVDRWFSGPIYSIWGSSPYPSWHHNEFVVCRDFSRQHSNWKQHIGSAMLMVDVAMTDCIHKMERVMRMQSLLMFLLRLCYALDYERITKQDDVDYPDLIFVLVRKMRLCFGREDSILGLNSAPELTPHSWWCASFLFHEQFPCVPFGKFDKKPRLPELISSPPSAKAKARPFYSSGHQG